MKDQSRCPRCGEQLYVASLVLCNVQGVAIHPDGGFNLEQASGYEVGDADTYCSGCGYTSYDDDREGD